MLRTSLILPVVCMVLLVSLSGCSPERSSVMPDASPGVPVIALPQESAEGTVGGASYVMYKPDPWNGDLVLIAHGLKSPYDPAEPQLPEEGFEILDGLLQMGYGVAITSFREAGWVVKEGMIATHQLRGIFAGRFGQQPHETFLIGYSMGGLIAVALTEKYPHTYAGTLSISGAVGGSEFLIDYIFGIRALFDYYYPGVLPGTVLNTPVGTDIEEASNAAFGAMLSNPGPALELASVDQLHIDGYSAEEMLTMIYVGIYVQLNTANDFYDRASGSCFFDNHDVWYTGTANDAALNAGVERFTMTQQARNYYTHYYEPTGELQRPVLMLHQSRDYIVPLATIEHYSAVVAAAGHADLLRQTIIDGFGHIDQPVEDKLSAFQELVEWANSMQ